MSQISKGWVYVVSNPAMPSLAKVGLTRKSPQDRQKGLSTESVPANFVVEFALEVDQERVWAIEGRAHELLSVWNDGKEFFRACPKTCAEAVLLAATGACIHSVLDPHGFLGRHAHDAAGFSREVSRLKIAIEGEDFEAVEKAVAEGFDPSAFAGADGSFLHWAARDWSEDLLGALLRRRREPLREGLSSELLAGACAAGWAQGVKILLGWGARAGRLDIVAACSRACAERDSDVAEGVDLLFAAGADVDARDEQGATALMWAAERGLLETAARLMRLGAQADLAADFSHPRWGGQSALWIGALNGRLALARSMLEEGADANARDARGRTLLNEILKAGDFPMACFLIDAGADLNAVDAEGEGFFSSLIARGIFGGERLTLARMGLRRGADLNAGSRSQWPLRRALETQSLEALAFLLESGAGVDGSPWGRESLARVGANFFEREARAEVDFESPCWDRREELLLAVCQACAKDPRSMEDVQALARNTPRGLFAYFLSRDSAPCAEGFEPLA